MNYGHNTPRLYYFSETVLLILNKSTMMNIVKFFFFNNNHEILFTAINILKLLSIHCSAITLISLFYLTVVIKLLF